MTGYREGLPERPERMRKLPINDKGYPVPWFVEWIEGKPDFRIMDARKWQLAVRYRRCWLCGDPLGVNQTFVAGPMCGINRTSAEPPSHRGCAIYAAQACPFLTLPKAVRREANFPEGGIPPAGIMLSRNPGVTMLWTCQQYTVYKSHGGASGYLIEMGEPKQVEWYAHGRMATRAEVDESIRTGLPSLQVAADAEGAEARQLLLKFIERLQPYLPEAA
jgi:hypothetical protein